MALPRKLPTFIHEEKVWTVDERLREFRHVVYGKMPEFVSYDSVAGQELLRHWITFSGYMVRGKSN